MLPPADRLSGDGRLLGNPDAAGNDRRLHDDDDAAAPTGRFRRNCLELVRRERDRLRQAVRDVLALCLDHVDSPSDDGEEFRRHSSCYGSVDIGTCEMVHIRNHIPLRILTGSGYLQQPAVDHCGAAFG